MSQSINNFSDYDISQTHDWECPSLSPHVLLIIYITIFLASSLLKSPFLTMMPYGYICCYFSFQFAEGCPSKCEIHFRENSFKSTLKIFVPQIYFDIFHEPVSACIAISFYFDESGVVIDTHLLNIRSTSSKQCFFSFLEQI